MKRPLTQNWDRSIASFAWARDGKSLFAITDHLGQRPLWAIDANTGRASAITGAGEVEGFTVGAARVYYVFGNLGEPADLYAVGFGGGEPGSSRHLNEALLAQRKFGEYEQFSFAGWNGENVFGYVVKPADFKPDQKYPGGLPGPRRTAGQLRERLELALERADLRGRGLRRRHDRFPRLHRLRSGVHGFDQRRLGRQAARGSRSSGLPPRSSNIPGWTAITPARSAASYGGYMMNWIAGRWPDRFKCIVSHDGIFDNRSMYYSTEELWFPEWEIGGPEYRNPAAMPRSTPSTT